MNQQTPAADVLLGLNGETEMRHFQWIAPMALAASTLLAGCATPQRAAEATMLQRLDSVLRLAAVDRTVQIKLQQEQVRTGESIGLSVGSAKGGYLYVFQLGTEGKKLSMVFPNAMDGANYLAPASTLQLPRSQWRMSTNGPAGVGYLLGVVTEQPLDLMSLQGQVAQGALVLPSGYGASLVPWREVTP
jgi:hypothetical protein